MPDPRTGEPFGGDASLPPRPPSYSKTELAELMLPHQANVLGKVFGGTILAMIDKSAATAAIRHAGRTCVTAQIDRVTFHRPIEIGALIRVGAIVTCVGRSSLEVEVEVCSLDVHNGTEERTNTSLVTMVAIDEHGKPAPVPPLLLETEEDRMRCDRAHQRMLERKRKRTTRRLS